MSSTDQIADDGWARPMLAWLSERPWRNALLAGLGGALAIGVLAALHAAHVAMLLIPPFGASCVLVFGVPASPFARPQNVIGGHVISAVMGLAAIYLAGPTAVGIGLGVGLAIAAMMVSDTVHPPAGANPIVVGLVNPGLGFLLAPVLVGAAGIVALGFVYNRIRRQSGV